MPPMSVTALSQPANRPRVLPKVRIRIGAAQTDADWRAMMLNKDSRQQADEVAIAPELAQGQEAGAHVSLAFLPYRLAHRHQRGHQDQARHGGEGRAPARA